MFVATVPCPSLIYPSSLGKVVSTQTKGELKMPEAMGGGWRVALVVVRWSKKNWRVKKLKSSTGDAPKKTDPTPAVGGG